MENPRNDHAYYWLSMHVPYGCRHTGACCTAGWPIPLERARVAPIEAAITERRLVIPPHWLGTVANQPADVAGVLVSVGGHCVFHQPSNAAPVRRCALHSALGHSALPTACQHFPRECLLDDRGGFVTLSHYCPTAAALLVEHAGPIEIVPGPSPVPDGVVEGFDARGAWPPLLRSGVLMDLAAYAAWEAHLVSWLGGTRNFIGRWQPDDVVRMFRAQARSLSRWRTGDRSLLDVVRALADGNSMAERIEPDWIDEGRLVAFVRASAGLPADEHDLEAASLGAGSSTDLQRVWSELASDWCDQAPVINRWLAAHAFASWTAYQSNGVVAHVRKLEMCLAVLRRQLIDAWVREGRALTRSQFIAAIRHADLLLVHLADREALAARLVTRRTPPPLVRGR